MALISEHVKTAHQRQVAILRALTPGQRLQQGRRLAGAMRQLLAAGFHQRHPDWSVRQVEAAVAERILHARTR